MRFKDLIAEDDDPGPVGSFIGGFKRGRDLNFTGKDEPTAQVKKKKSTTAGRAEIQVDRYQLNDLKYVMQAVLKGNVNTLSSAQIESARELLKQLNSA